MELSTSILLGVGLAADACAVSLSSGLTIRHIKLYKAIKIALFFSIFQMLMPLFGWLIGFSFRELLGQIDHWLIFFILSFIGGKMIYESQESTTQKFNCLEFYTLITLSIATSIDALAAGLGLSVWQNYIFETVAIIGIITFILSFIAVYIGYFCGDLLKNKIEIIGGLILISLGIKVLLEAIIV